MFCSICGLNTHYEIYGEEHDKAIVFLPGWAAKISLYEKALRLMGEKYKVYALDLPGFGETEEPKTPFCLDDYCTFVNEFIASQKINKTILMGHSFGGRICIKFAALSNCGFLIDKMILCDAAGIKPKKTVKQKIKGLSYKIKKNFAKAFLSAERQEALRRKHGSADYVNATPIMRQTLVKTVNEDLTPLLEKISVETLLIWGKNDTATPLSDGVLMEQKMKNAGLAQIDNAGHFPFLDQPHVFSRILISYLKIKE